MVFFTCNACGASLKKNQVEKHYQNECRNCEVLSCMDCGKDFYGDEYAYHTKCISEAEKYQGALFKETGGGGVTKGEKKQQEWLEKVKQSTTTAKVSCRISSLLEKIAEYPNVPRKKKKFENFVRNSINVRDQSTLSQLWEAFSEATKEPESPPLTNGSQKSSGQNTDKTVEEVTKLNKDEAQSMEEESGEKKKKKKSKKHSAKADECKDHVECNGELKGSTDDIVDHIAIETPKKKKKKRDKHRACEAESEASTESTSGKKKRKHVHSDKEEVERNTKKAKLCTGV